VFLEVANVCLFLASDESSYVTCGCFEVSGKHIAVGDRMFLEMQDFDFCPSLIEFYPNFIRILPNLSKFAQV